MTKAPVRVRFAPSPTGMMHLGNVRAALMNYVFAKHHDGTFIIRIEDTDFERNFDPSAQQILADLAWLGLEYTEGPIKGGPHAPYYQSMRTSIYVEKLKEFEQRNLIYRCFCSSEELEKKRQRQLALKQPPRYDRACLTISPEQLQEYLVQQKPFIWRFKLNQDEPVAVRDLAHGTIHFDMKSFSDIPLTRQDGSFTFMFANFVDDMLMEISHVIRGGDHLSNTAGQVAMYLAAGVTPPVFWHLPTICNAEGKKLSKRDFGFSLHDLRNSGYVPEAIDNYLGIIGGSFEHEILSLDELAHAINFEQLGAANQIKYDVEKLNWLNRKWLEKYTTEQLLELCMPYLTATYEYAHTVPTATMHTLIAMSRTELTTLHDVIGALEFYFKAPDLSKKMVSLVADMELNELQAMVKNNLEHLQTPDVFMQHLKKAAQQKEISPKTLFVVLRIALTGKAMGPSINDLIEMLGVAEARRRLEALTLLSH